VELLPAGNLQMPTASLQVEWCYTTFHNTDRVKHVCSCHKTCKKTLKTLAESIELIHDTRINDGNIQHHQLNKVQEDAKCKMFCKHKEQYVCKLLNIIFSAISWRKFERLQSARCCASTKSNTCANCAIFPTSTRPAGCKICNTARAISIVVIVANASTPSSGTTVDAAMTRVTTTWFPPSAKTRL
jgi:hypothetical protein